MNTGFIINLVIFFHPRSDTRACDLGPEAEHGIFENVAGSV
jgi:hypothetical protein